MGSSYPCSLYRPHIVASVFISLKVYLLFPSETIQNPEDTDDVTQAISLQEHSKAIFALKCGGHSVHDSSHLPISEQRSDGFTEHSVLITGEIIYQYGTR